jgi:protein gp37
MENSAISWCHHTFNTWWGCAKVARGCKHCYAERIAEGRYGKGLWGPEGRRVIASEAQWEKPPTWDREAHDNGTRYRVFCGSMCDVCEDREDLVAPRQRLWKLIRATPNLDWLLLTKRPQNYAKLMPRGEWPNVWLGTSVAERRDLWCLDALRKAPQSVPVRFVSAEPLVEDLGTVDLSGINWLIVGGESGPDHDDMDHAWARSLRGQCEAAGVAFFFKQSSGYHSETGIRLDGKLYHAFPQG